MNHHFRYPATVLVLLFLLMSWYPVCWSAGNGDKIEAAGSNSESVLVPPPGNPLRRAVLDALRNELERFHGKRLVFKVIHLKVKDGWAWVHTQPQSPDGMERYEDVSALLNNKDGAWNVMEMPCTEVDNPDCLNCPEYFTGLKKRFPKVPVEIFTD